MTPSTLQKAQLVAPLTPAKNATRLSVSKPEPRRKPRIEMNTGTESYDVRPQLTPNSPVKVDSEAAIAPEGPRVYTSSWESIVGTALIFAAFFAALNCEWWLPLFVRDGGQPW